MPPIPPSPSSLTGRVSILFTALALAFRYPENVSPCLSSGEPVEAGELWYNQGTRIFQVSLGF